MPTLTRELVLKTLQEGWGMYVGRFRKLSPEGQAAFLAQQGYARLADLLAHVIGWWREGQHAVTLRLIQPDYAAPDYAVDDFNARAVAAFAHADEAAVIRTYEETRQAWVALVNRLPAEAFENPQQAQRLEIEVIGHLAEHALP